MRTRLGLLWLALAMAACGNGTADGKTATDAGVVSDAASADAGDGLAQDAGGQDAISVDGTTYVDVPGTATFETADAQRIVVLDYNVMCSFCMNSDHPEWEQDFHVRLPWLRDVIKRHDPDLMGLQEFQELVPTDPKLNQPQQIVAPDNAYDFEYYHFKKGDLFESDYDDATVFWRKTRFDKLDTGVFWLSPTPDQAFTNGFKQPQEPRMVVWVLLHDKSANRDFYFANTHFDNNAPSQTLSAPLVLERLGKLAGVHPLIFTGDFNSNPSSKAYQILTQGVDGKGFHFVNSADLAKHSGTLANVTPPEPFEPEQIDHIFMAGATFDVTWWLTDLWRYGERIQAPSDHNGAIVTSLQWQ